MSVSTGARPAARAAKVNSDHRKEQNRIASRNYRAKRKQKLALLEHILSDPTPDSSSNPSLNLAGSSQPSMEEDPSIPPVPVHQLSLWPQELSNETATTAAASVVVSDPMLAVSAASYPVPVMPSWMLPLSVPQQLSFPEVCAPPPEPTPLPTTNACLDLPVVGGGGGGLLPDLFLCPDMSATISSSSASPDSVDPADPADPVDIGHPPVRRNKASIDHLLRGVRSLQPSQKRLLLQALLEEDDDDDSPDSAITSVHLRRSLTPLSTLTLHLRRTAFRAAVLHNCLAFGLPDPAHMFNDETDPVTGLCEADELQSPFAVDPATASAAVARGPAHVAACVAAARRRLLQRQARCGRTTPRDLLPIDAQILVAHHPYLDVIPFRGFRARALALLADMEGQPAAALSTITGIFGLSTTTTIPSEAVPSSSASPSSLAPIAALFDEYELCYDMDFADGLVCWGSANGSTTGGLSAQARRTDRPGGMQACVPWDMRGWEPQVWFLKKYWFLVGGWDDDMWRSCRWWHSMRGEHLDYSVFASPGY